MQKSIGVEIGKVRGQSFPIDQNHSMTEDLLFYIIRTFFKASHLRIVIPIIGTPDII